MDETVVRMTQEYSGCPGLVAYWTTSWRFTVLVVDEQVVLQLGWTLGGTYLYSFFAANTVIKGIYKRLTAEEDRHGCLELNSLFPNGLVPGVDFLNLAELDHLERLRQKAIINVAETELRATIRQLPVDQLRAGVQEHEPYVILQQDVDPLQIVMWPFNYWMLRTAPGARLADGLQLTDRHTFGWAANPLAIRLEYLRTGIPATQTTTTA
jgi:hypothetical protein